MTSAAAQVARLRSLEDGPRAFFDVVAFGETAIPQLEAMLRGVSESVAQPRRLAAEALGAIGTSAARDALLGALTDSGTRSLDPVLRLAEDAVLASIAEELAHLREQRAVKPLMLLLSHHPHAGCVRALGAFGEPMSIPTLVACLRDDFARGAAREALPQFGEAAIEALTAALLLPKGRQGMEGSSSIEGRCAAADLLAELDAPPLPLIAALHDVEPLVRIHGALALSVRGQHELLTVAPTLLDALEAADWTLQQTICERLLPLGSQLVPMLLAIVDGRDARKQVRAVELMGRLEEIAPLIGLRWHRAPLVRSAAATALGMIPNAAATTALEKWLSDPDGEVRLAAFHSLAQRRSLPFGRSLRMLTDRDPRVRRSVRAFLRSRTSFQGKR